MCVWLRVCVYVYVSDLVFLNQRFVLEDAGESYANKQKEVRHTKGEE